jgi:hypothetical protein
LPKCAYRQCKNSPLFTVLHSYPPGAWEAVGNKLHDAPDGARAASRYEWKARLRESTARRYSERFCLHALAAVGNALSVRGQNIGPRAMVCQLQFKRLLKRCDSARDCRVVDRKGRTYRADALG